MLVRFEVQSCIGSGFKVEGSSGRGALGHGGVVETQGFRNKKGAPCGSKGLIREHRE